MAGETSRSAAFAPDHRHDRTMIAATVFAIWVAIVLGFAIDIVKRAQSGALAFPLIVHLHVIAYTGWLVLLAAQVVLVRTGHAAVHRRLGFAAVILLPAMLLLGPATAYYGVANNPYMPDKWIASLSVNFTNALGSLVLLTAGFLMRRHPGAHKRLMIMGTIALTEPGFSRIWAPRLGEGHVPFYFSTYIGTFLLVLAVGVYDFATRHRLHSAYLAAALWIFANQAVADWLFHQPFWLAAMKAITGHPA